MVIIGEGKVEAARVDGVPAAASDEGDKAGGDRALSRAIGVAISMGDARDCVLSL